MSPILNIAPNTLLRPLTDADAIELFALVDSDRKHLAPWLPWVKHTVSPINVLEFIERVAAQNEAGTAMVHGIEQAGQLVGVAGYNVLDPNNKNGEIGYWLTSTATGQGLMTAAVVALLQHGFEQLGLIRIQLRAGVENFPSRAIAERAGFCLEGVMRHAEVTDSGPIDLAVYSVLKSEWAPAEATKETVEKAAKKFQCPSCERQIFNRRLLNCEFCQTVLPAELLLSKEQQKAIDEERTKRAADRRDHDRMWLELRHKANRSNMSMFGPSTFGG